MPKPARKDIVALLTDVAALQEVTLAELRQARAELKQDRAERRALAVRVEAMFVPGPAAGPGRRRGARAYTERLTAAAMEAAKSSEPAAEGGPSNAD